MWKVRHEGSPKQLETTLDQIRQGLADGRWETTDEVMGPGETQWVAIESHPQLEELAAEMEPPPQPHYDDETRLDMTALIDVCLVLLVFFILTTTVAALTTRVEAPAVEKSDNKVKIKVITQAQVDQTVLVTAKMVDGKPVVTVEDEVVPLEQMSAFLRRYARSKNRTAVVLDQDDAVPHYVQVQVFAAAKELGLEGKLNIRDRK